MLYMRVILAARSVYIPSWSRLAMSTSKLIFALCVLQAHVWLARCREDKQLESEINSHCDHDSLRFVTKSYVIGVAVVFSNIKYTNGSITIEYGTEVTVSCIGANPSRLSMTENGIELQTVKSERTIAWTTTPDVPTTEYVCTDTETNCNTSVIVLVAPAFLHTFSEYEISAGEYYIPYGNSMLLTCSGPDASQLVITKDGEYVLTKKVNQTMIEWSGIPDLQKSEYICADLVTNYNRHKHITVTPLTYVKLENETIKEYFDPYTVTNEYKLAYGDHVELFCSGPRPVRIVGLDQDNKDVLMEHVNETTVKAYITNSKLGESNYACVDNEVSNFISKIRLNVAPRIDVASPAVRRDGKEHKYLMKYGDPLEVSCSGPDAEKLVLSEASYGIKPDYIRTTKTAIKWTFNGLQVLEQFYRFYNFICGNGEKRSRAIIRVETIPETVDFHCISHNLQYLNCSWMAPRYSTNFTLYNQQQDGSYARICSKSDSLMAGRRFCVWYDDDNPRYRNVEILNFLMESCNGISCNNQTYLIDHWSIVKVDPVRDLRVYDKSSRSVVLQWIPTQDDLDYKVEYYSGSSPIEVDVSPVLCAYVCSVELSLPCPGQVYRVLVYQRLKKAVGEQFWSEPSSVTFETDRDNEHTDIVDPACVRKPTCL